MVEQFTVNIQHRYYFSLLNDWHHNLTFAGTAAGYVSGKLLYVGYNQRHGLLPAAATYATAFADAGAGYRTLKRPENQFLFAINGIKAHPPPAKLLLEGGGYIGQIGDQIVFTFQRTLS